jgi:hypothetical protein
MTADAVGLGIVTYFEKWILRPIVIEVNPQRNMGLVAAINDEYRWIFQCYLPQRNMGLVVAINDE